MTSASVIFYFTFFQFDDPMTVFVDVVIIVGGHNDRRAQLINFLILAAVVYYGFKILGLDRLDKKKE